MFPRSILKLSFYFVNQNERLESPIIELKGQKILIYISIKKIHKIWRKKKFTPSSVNRISLFFRIHTVFVNLHCLRLLGIGKLETVQHVWKRICIWEVVHHEVSQRIDKYLNFQDKCLATKSFFCYFNFFLRFFFLTLIARFSHNVSLFISHFISEVPPIIIIRYFRSRMTREKRTRRFFLFENWADLSGSLAIDRFSRRSRRREWCGDPSHSMAVGQVMPPESTFRGDGSSITFGVLLTIAHFQIKTDKSWLRNN